MIKIACVHTGASPKIIQLIEDEFAAVMSSRYRISHITLPEVISEIIEAGRVTPYATAILLNAYSFCHASRANIVLNVCSSVGDVADRARDAFITTGMEIVRIDRAMCREAVKRHSRIGVMGTLATTLTPSVALVSQCGNEINKKVVAVPILADGGFNKTQDELNTLLCDTASNHAANVDAIVLAQASMTLAEETLARNLGLPVYSSPKYAAKAISQAIDA